MTSTSKGTALITGASSGIGATYADRLARRGYDLILVARSRDSLDEVAGRITAATGRMPRIVTADLNSKLDCLRIESLLHTDPSITMLVNNAGIGAVNPLVSSDIDDMERMIELNVTALTRLVYAAVPGFVARKQGSIINLASIVAIAPEFLNGVYGATKAYVLALTMSLHKELAAENIRLQAVLPGAIATPFWKASGGSLDLMPSNIVMQVDDLVDAALAGYDLGELVTLPSVPEVADWNAYEAARQKLLPNLSLSAPAERYRAQLLS